MPTKKYQFECEKCHRRYRTEARYLSHSCQVIENNELAIEAIISVAKDVAKQNVKKTDALIKEFNNKLDMFAVTKCFSCTWYTTSSEFSGLTDVSVEHLGSCEGPVVATSRPDKTIVIITKSNGEYNIKTLITSKYG